MASLNRSGAHLPASIHQSSTRKVEIGMKTDEVLTNEFIVRFDEEAKELLIFTVHDGVPADVPIRHSARALKDMGRSDGARFVGETILLLVPTLRSELFGEKT